MTDDIISVISVHNVSSIEDIEETITPECDFENSNVSQAIPASFSSMNQKITISSEEMQMVTRNSLGNRSVKNVEKNVHDSDSSSGKNNVLCSLIDTILKAYQL